MKKAEYFTPEEAVNKLWKWFRYYAIQVAPDNQELRDEIISEMYMAIIKEIDRPCTLVYFKTRAKYRTWDYMKKYYKTKRKHEAFVKDYLYRNKNLIEDDSELEEERENGFK